MSAQPRQQRLKFCTNPHPRHSTRTCTILRHDVFELPEANPLNVTKRHCALTMSVLTLDAQMCTRTAPQCPQPTLSLPLQRTASDRLCNRSLKRYTFTRRGTTAAAVIFQLLVMQTFHCHSSQGTLCKVCFANPCLLSTEREQERNPMWRGVKSPHCHSSQGTLCQVCFANPVFCHLNYRSPHSLPFVTGNTICRVCFANPVFYQLNESKRGTPYCVG